jgi:hypothetical protein
MVKQYMDNIDFIKAEVAKQSDEEICIYKVYDD